MINTGISAYSSYAFLQSAAVYSAVPVEVAQNDSASEQINSISEQDDIKDEAIISEEAQSLYNSEVQEETSQTDNADNLNKNISNSAEEELSPEQKQEVSELKSRDMEVKQHEQAHRAAATGSVSTSAPNYEYQTGPDGNKYAIGGEVNISYNKSSDPEENIKNAEAVKRAALAPADPSGQDLKVAQGAEQAIMQAKIELASENQQDVKENTLEDDEDKSV